jgi:hypothetical protein
MAQHHRLFDANRAKAAMTEVVQIGAAYAAIGNTHCELVWAQGFGFKRV